MTVRSTIVNALGPYIIYPWARRLTRGVPKILMYHRFSRKPVPGRVSIAAFDKQVSYLRRSCNVISMSHAIRALKGGCQLPANPVIITIDDGYADFYEYAYPVLRKYGVSATFYVTTGFVNGDLWLWPDKVTWLLDSSDSLDWPVELAAQSTIPGYLNEEKRSCLWKQIVSYLLSVPEERKLDWIEVFAYRLGKTLPAKPPKGYEPVGWGRLREMQQQGIEIGGHSDSHATLSKVVGPRLDREIADCYAMLVAELGDRKNYHFCYPNGHPEDYNVEAKERIQATGFLSSVVSFYDQHMCDDIFEMRRFGVGSEFGEFRKVTNGTKCLSSKWLNETNAIETDN